MTDQPAITVYTAGPGCQPCNLTRRHLDRRGLLYTEVPIGSDDNITEAALYLGLRSAPIVCVGIDECWDGYRPDRIDALASAVQIRPVPA
jgi:glutaredoxin-like protein NrdH